MNAKHTPELYGTTKGAALDTAKAFLDGVMGKCAGDGMSPAQASAALFDATGVVMSPRECWNLWIGEND